VLVPLLLLVGEGAGRTLGPLANVLVCVSERADKTLGPLVIRQDQVDLLLAVTADLLEVGVIRVGGQSHVSCSLPAPWARPSPARAATCPARRPGPAGRRRRPGRRRPGAGCRSTGAPGRTTADHEAGPRARGGPARADWFGARAGLHAALPRPSLAFR